METFHYSINKMLKSDHVSRIPESISKYAYIDLKTTERPENIKFLVSKEKLLELITGI